MGPSFFMTFVSVWQCCSMFLLHNTKEVQKIHVTSTSKREKRASEMSSVNTGEQDVSPDHIDVILQTFGINFLEQSFGQHCVESYIAGYHDVFRGDCHEELAKSLNYTLLLPCKDRCSVFLEKSNKPSAVICFSTSGLNEICHDSLLKVNCTVPFRVTLKCSDQQNHTDIQRNTNQVAGSEAGYLIGGLLGGVIVGILIPHLIYLLLYFRKKTCVICKVMLKWRKEENTRYQDNVENETRTQSTNDETDKYTTIQDAQVRAKSNVYRDTIHDINTKPLPRTPHRHSASNGRIPNAQNDSLYNDGAFEIDINAQEEYQDPFPESKWPKNCHINLLKRAKSVTSKEETSGIPSYVTIIGEGECSDFKVVHKCSSCQKKSLFKIKELENEIEEVQQLAPEETVRESPYFMSEQTEDSDIHNYKKMNEAVSEL